MKPAGWFLVASLSLAVSGCGTLLPKKVELFQKKVKPVPVLSASAQETQRQAAAFVAAKTEEVKVAAVKTQADPAVVAPAEEASIAASALSDSLGTPEKDWVKPAAKLKAELQKDTADLREDVSDYTESVKDTVGKKIEGTGLVRVGYFTYIGGIIVLLGLLWAAVRVYGAFNPVVGLGVSAVTRVPTAVLARGMGEIVKGGQKFRTWVAEHKTWPEEVKAEIDELFTSAQKEEQSSDIRNLLRQK